MRPPELRRRYARLIATMQTVAHLSEGEAGHCLACHRAGFNGAGEAVNHFGWVLAVIRAAIASRHRLRAMNGGRLA